MKIVILEKNLFARDAFWFYIWFWKLVWHYNCQEYKATLSSNVTEYNNAELVLKMPHNEKEPKSWA